MINLYVESEFFYVNKEEEWREGVCENININHGIKIFEEYKYSAYRKVELNSIDEFINMLDYACDAYGFIYYIDSYKALWEYDYINNELTKLYNIVFSGQISLFQMISNKLYILFKQENQYYLRRYTVNYGKMLNEIKLDLQKMLACTINVFGDVFALNEDNTILWLHTEDGNLETININKFISSTGEHKKEKFIISVYKDKIAAVSNIDEGYLKLISIEDLKNIKLINTFEFEKVIDFNFDNEGCLLICAKYSETAFLYYTNDYSSIRLIKYFNEDLVKCKLDACRRLYLLDGSNVIHIFKKELKLREHEKSKNYSGIYYSRVFDSQREEMKWNKLSMESYIPGNTQVKINYYAFDNLNMLFNNNMITVDNFIKDEQISLVEKEEYFKSLWNREIINSKEALFLKAKGRHLLLRIELVGTEEVTPVVYKLKVYYNRNSYLKYLPEIYSYNSENNDFLERYLSIFEAFYMSIEEKVDCIANYFDIDKVSGEFLKWLCEWLGMGAYKNWQEEKLKKLLKNAPFLNKKKGTRKAIEIILRIYLGVKPIIIENFQFEEIEKESIEVKKLVENLYGNNPFSYTVLINISRNLTLEEIDEINNILSMESPAYCEYHLVILKHCISLDKHSYLGVNSMVAGYLPLKLDGKAVLPFNSVLLEEDESF